VFFTSFDSRSFLISSLVSPWHTEHSKVYCLVSMWLYISHNLSWWLTYSFIICDFITYRKLFQFSCIWYNLLFNSKYDVLRKVPRLLRRMHILWLFSGIFYGCLLYSFHLQCHLILKFLFILFLLFIYSYVHTLFGSFLPPAHCPLPLFPPPLTSRQNLFCPLLQFCWREDISNSKERFSGFASLK
jgi:hypothetical protein